MCGSAYPGPKSGPVVQSRVATVGAGERRAGSVLSGNRVSVLQIRVLEMDGINVGQPCERAQCQLTCAHNCDSRQAVLWDVHCATMEKELLKPAGSVPQSGSSRES